jgi:hypothetical protein
MTLAAARARRIIAGETMAARGLNSGSIMF